MFTSALMRCRGTEATRWAVQLGRNDWYNSVRPYGPQVAWRATTRKALRLVWLRVRGGLASPAHIFRPAPLARAWLQGGACFLSRAGLPTGSSEYDGGAWCPPLAFGWPHSAASIRAYGLLDARMVGVDDLVRMSVLLVRLGV